jgi:hypothetical protein
MNEILVGITGIVLLLLLFATGIELGFAMGLIGFLGFAYLNGFQPALNLLARDFYDVITIMDTRSSRFLFSWARSVSMPASR